MPYIGNTIRAADDYRLIDDISSSFNGSTTSFALQVAGSAPVPFPKSPQQVLISVNGVIQEPDPTGASGFNLVGTNIVFSSAPTNGHAFFGIIYATADYLNSGGNFPSGSTGAPSLTFIGDEDTGIYRKGSGSIGFVSNSTEIANTDSNGITISSGDLILGDNRKAKFGASEDLQIYHDGTYNRIAANAQIFLQNKAANETYLAAYENGAVELYHNNSKKFETTSSGITVSGTIDSTGNINSTNNIEIDVDNGEFRCGAGGDFKISHSGSENILRSDFPTVFRNGANNETLAQLTPNGAVKLHYDNSKKFETTSSGVTVTGTINFGSGMGSGLNSNGFNINFADSDGAQDMVKFGASGDLRIFHDGSHSRIDDAGTGSLLLQTNGGNIQLNKGTSENMLIANVDGSVELYHNNVKKIETTSSGVTISGGTVANGHVTLPDHTGSQDGKLRFGASTDFEIFHNGTSNNTEVNHTTNTGHLQITGNRLKLMNYDGPETYIDCISNGAVELYYDASKKFETKSNGAKISGTLELDGGTNQGANDATLYITASNNNDWGLIVDYGTASGGKSEYGAKIVSRTGSTHAFSIAQVSGGSHAEAFLIDGDGNIDKTGNITPRGNNSFDLGSTSLRWANVYTNDLNLSNEGSSNDVDSTWGDYTIQEGFEDLFLINNRTGKKFKFNLTEVS